MSGHVCHFFLLLHFSQLLVSSLRPALASAADIHFFFNPFCLFVSPAPSLHNPKKPWPIRWALRPRSTSRETEPNPGLRVTISPTIPLVEWPLLSLVNTLFHSVCLLISHPPPFSFHVTSLLPLIRLCSYLLKLTVLLFILTIFFSSLFFRHLRAGSPSKFQPGTHMHHLTFPLTHLISLFMVGHSPSVFCAALV